MNSGYKVAIVSSGLGHITRGIETWTEDLGYELLNRGIDVTIFKGGGEDRPPIERRIYCIQRYSRLAKVLLKLSPRFGWHYGFGSGYQLEQLTFAFRLILILGRKYDIVHTKDPYLAMLLRIARKVKTIKAKEILSHGTDETPEYRKQFEYLQELAPYYIQEMQERGYYGKNWCAIPNFVDIKKFKPGDSGEYRKKLGIPDEAYVILSVAAINRDHKRTDWLIKEVASLKNRHQKDIVLLVAGGWTNQTEEIMSLGKNLLGDRMKFLINVPRKEMPELYKAADIFVMCSLKEIFGTAFLEALASGIPAVGHKYPVTEWIIGPGGECVDMTKEDELSQILEKYMNDENYLRRKGQQAREWTVQEFSKSSVVDRIIEMYKRVLEN
jgi:1,2-diacylglycerol 3-alpha-glucosyltransferase